MLVRMILLTQRGFWLDEWYTHHAINFTMSSLIMERFLAGHSPVYFLYAKVWMLLFGEGEFALRMSTAIMTPLAVIGLAQLVRQLGLRRILTPLMFLAALHPYWQRIGTEFRYMMPLVTVGTWLCWAVVKMMREEPVVLHWPRAAFLSAVFFALLAMLLTLPFLPTIDGPLLYLILFFILASAVGAASFLVCKISDQVANRLMVIALGGLMMLIHPSAQFVLLALLVFVVLSSRRHKSSATKNALPILLAWLFSVPLLYFLSQVSTGAGGGPAGPDFTSILVHQVETFFGEDGSIEFVSGIDDDVFTVTSIATYIASLVFAVIWLKRENPPYAAKMIASLLIAIPGSIVLYSVFANDRQGPIRYVAFTSLPVLFIFAMAWVEAGRHRWRGVVYRGAFAVVLAVNLLAQAFSQGEWHRETILWLAENRATGDAIVCIGRDMNTRAMRYHGLTDESATLDGINSEERNYGLVYWEMRGALERGDVAWLFLYHEGNVPVRKVLKQLAGEGFVAGALYLQPSHNVRLIGIARTPEGARRLSDTGAFSLPVIADERLDDDDVWDELNSIHPPWRGS